jgi:hypothetical protein
VLDQNDRQLAVLMQPANELGDFVGFLVAHAGGGLVEQQQARLERQRHHDFGGALIAMGQFADLAIGFDGETAQVHEFTHPRADLFIVHLRQPCPQAQTGRDLHRNAQILAHCELGKDFRHLKRPGYAAPHAPRRQKIGDVLAVKDDAARGRTKEPGDQVEKSGLAGAVRADDSAQLPRLDRHRNIVQGDQTAETLRYALNLQQTHELTPRSAGA